MRQCVLGYITQPPSPQAMKVAAATSRKRRPISRRLAKPVPPPPSYKPWRYMRARVQDPTLDMLPVVPRGRRQTQLATQQAEVLCYEV